MKPTDIVVVFGMKKTSLDSARGQAVTSRIIVFLVQDLRSFNIIAGSRFVDLMSFVSPNYLLAGTNYYSSKIADKYALTPSLGCKTTSVLCRQSQLPSTYGHRRPTMLNSELQSSSSTPKGI